ncbi:MAG: DUF2339 domain-containing protein, partial [Bacteroidia bacterium]
MEIFLLLVIITLVIIFHTTYSSKFKRLHEHMNHMQRELAKVMQAEKPLEESKITSEKKEEVIIPAKKIIPPVIQEEKIIEKKEEIQPVIIPQKEEQEPVKVKIAAIENPQVIQQQSVQPAKPSWWEDFKERNPDLEKFIGENLLSKIAITILVLGIAFFVKY